MSTGGSGGSWRFDDEEGAAGEPMEVLADPASSSPGRRPGPTRRQLLFGGAVVLAGGVAWAVSRGSASPPARSAALPSAAPGPGSPRPAPSGPKPRWTYRGTGRLQNDRVAGPTHPPLFLSGADLAQLDPASGSALRHFSVSTAGPLIVGGTLLLDAGGAELDRITAHDLDSGDSDWQYTLPASGSGSGPGQLRALDSDGTTVYCRGESSGGPGPNDPGLTGSTLIAVSLATRQPLWQVPLDHNELALRLAVVPGGRLLVQGTFSTFLLDARDGHRLWTLGGIGWLTADQQWIYASDSSTGLRVLSLADGSVHRTISPGAGESWRYLSPLPGDGGRLVLFNDDGLVTALDSPDGPTRWTCQLPFRLDYRSRPLSAGGLVLVPGPTDGGVVALDAATGARRWTFQDGEPGVDVWSLTTDGRYCYAGHDLVLHAIDLRSA
ncbi:PQQ-binding-like beta-propeller repeat protein [Kitasatospora sp. NBC_01250]|uniref:outer membrane protein assembly factor BamB family protein n=1 Tax=unclassified Kitasatospora TaxID=2633591 RepID=UPI002E15EC7E|nr:MULTISPECIES: PQQ-binding-like beta-propeller repeat protein [unclassified Kitasatospora]WSJ66434.1 PQQ-binding-like beta-propeller repeat protein [Kitasatospora sp. NBC_01302]